MHKSLLKFQKQVTFNYENFANATEAEIFDTAIQPQPFVALAAEESSRLKNKYVLAQN